MSKSTEKSRPIVLSSHPPAGSAKPSAIHWGAKSPEERGAIVATLSDPTRRNVIGAHAGSYALYRALAIAAGKLSPIHVPDLSNTLPAEGIGPHPQWSEPQKIVSMDPWGHLVAAVYAGMIAAGWDIRPTIAVTKARINIPELRDVIAAGTLVPDEQILLAKGDVRVTKIAIEPVWWLPGVAARFGIDEQTLRRGLFKHTAGTFPELITRPDLKVFLPPIGGMTVYCMGDIAAITDPERKLAVRVHDECNGSDVFGSDICTCRPYLVHGIEVCIQTAQAGGAGLIVYNRKEGRALGEVTKFLVYNARKRQVGGDRAETYFERTECVAGVQDMRFQELMPDVLAWLGVTRIDHFVSMSDTKYQSIIQAGIEIKERIAISDGLIPTDARVEMDAKKAAGYFTDRVPGAEDLSQAKGRKLDE